MSDLSNISPSSDHPPDENESASPQTMIFTMVLLIAGFLLASALMINRTLDAKSPHGTSGFQWTAIMEKGKSLWNRPAKPEKPATKEVQAEKASPLENLSKIISLPKSDKIHWPKMKLTGFGTSADGSEAFAIINGTQVYQGQYAGKIKLEEVRTHNVVVEYQGERKTLTINSDN